MNSWSRSSTAHPLRRQTGQDYPFWFGRHRSDDQRQRHCDLLIVEPEPGDRREEYVRIRRALKGLGHPFDIVLIATQWFEESKGVIGGIAYPAEKQGKTIYEAA